ncbi:MAG: hypothetical protein QOJ59_5198 [Thermomicrobiales bacterium]|nr:hypothetical protein [Thermomicrobiales bacterium]
MAMQCMIPSSLELSPEDVVSLSSHLEQPDSPIRRFLVERFPNTRPVVADVRAAMTGARTILPADAEGYTWSMMGTAVDFRLRGYFEPVSFTSQPTAGVMNLWGAEGAGLLENVAARLDDDAEDVESVGRRLDRASEELLARYCLVLSYFETVFRSGRIPPEIASIDPSRATPETLLSIPKQVAVDDLCALSWAFYDRHADVLTKPVILNPTFEGSDDIGGADADLVIDGCLWEIKTYKQPQAKQIYETAYQLLGYALLDYDDSCGIREIGIYFSRQATLVRWPLVDFMAKMAGSDVPPLNELRTAFAKVAEKARKAEERMLRRLTARPS